MRVCMPPGRLAINKRTGMSVAHITTASRSDGTLTGVAGPVTKKPPQFFGFGATYEIPTHIRGRRRTRCDALYHREQLWPDQAGRKPAQPKQLGGRQSGQAA